MPGDLQPARMRHPLRLEAAAAVLPYAAFLIGVPLAAHLLYSRLGFNPTDDGFVLAYARRMLDGQIPHRDFIAIHLAGSGLVHMPFVAFGGRHAYLISRLFVWVELAGTALVWTLTARIMLGLARNALAEIAVALIAFALSAHYFPVMAWHTIDGLFFAALGVLMCLRREPALQLAGFVLVGFAVLCKQNYVFLAPTVVLLFGGGRLRPWLAVALPGFLYFTVVAAAGGLHDAVEQLTAQTSLGETGFLKYYWEYATGWGALFGWLAMLLLHADEAKPLRFATWQRIAAAAGIAAVLVQSGLSLAKGQVLNATAFGLFGMSLGAALYFLFTRGGAPGRLGLVSVLTMWCASLSLGYNTPVLACGFTAVYLLLLLFTVSWPQPVRGFLPAGLALLAAFMLFEFNLARERYVYLEPSATELTQPLDGVLPGGDGLLTDRNTYFFMADLNRAIAKTGGRYAILPDLAGWWPMAAEANPLPVDWAQSSELATPTLLRRVTDSIMAQRGHLTVIVQKVRAASLARGFVPLIDSDYYATAAFVRHHLTKTGETACFEIYR